MGLYIKIKVTAVVIRLVFRKGMNSIVFFSLSFSAHTKKGYSTKTVTEKATNIRYHICQKFSVLSAKASSKKGSPMLPIVA